MTANDIGHLTMDLRVPTIIKAHGEFDLLTIWALATALMVSVRCTVGHRTAEVRLDLSHVSFLDVLSINIIAEVHRMLATEGRRLTIVNPGPAVRRIIDMTGLDHILDVQADKTGRAADSPHPVRHSLPVRGR